MISSLRDLRFQKSWLIGGWTFVIAALIVCELPARYVEVASLNDKVEHAAGFALLTLWFCGIYLRSRYWRIAICFLLFGVLIEILQAVINVGRHAEVLDVCADAAGVIVGVLMALTPIGEWPRWIEGIFPKR